MEKSDTIIKTSLISKPEPPLTKSDKLPELSSDELFQRTARFFQEGIQRKYSKDYLAQKVVKWSEENPEAAKQLGWPKDFISIKKEVVFPLMESLSSPKDKVSGEVPVTTHFMVVLGPNGRPMKFDGLGKTVVDSGGNLNSLEKRYFNARASGDTEKILKIHQDLQGSIVSDRWILAKFHDLERVYQEGGRVRRPPTPEEFREGLKRMADFVFHSGLALGLVGALELAAVSASGYAVSLAESSLIRGMAFPAASPKTQKLFNWTKDFAKGFFLPPMEKPNTWLELWGGTSRFLLDKKEKILKKVNEIKNK